MWRRTRTLRGRSDTLQSRRPPLHPRLRNAPAPAKDLSDYNSDKFHPENLTAEEFGGFFSTLFYFTYSFVRYHCLFFLFYDTLLSCTLSYLYAICRKEDKNGSILLVEGLGRAYEINSSYQSTCCGRFCAAATG